MHVEGVSCPKNAQFSPLTVKADESDYWKRDAHIPSEKFQKPCNPEANESRDSSICRGHEYSSLRHSCLHSSQGVVNSKERYMSWLPVVSMLIEKNAQKRTSMCWSCASCASFWYQKWWILSYAWILGIIFNVFHLFSTPIYTLITVSSSITDAKLCFFACWYHLNSCC